MIMEFSDTYYLGGGVLFFDSFRRGGWGLFSILPRKLGHYSVTDNVELFIENGDVS